MNTGSANLSRRLRHAAMLAVASMVASAVTALAGAPARADTIHVSPQGTDRATGRTPEEALFTIAEAVRRVQPGDTIELGEGVYAGALINRPGRADAWIRMRPREGARAIVQGEARGPALYFYHRSCDENAPPGTVCQPLYWELQGLDVRGSPQGEGDGYTVKIDTPFVRLVGNDLCCSRVDIVKLVRTADDVEIIGNRIHHNRAKEGDNAQGIDIVGADRTRVAFNHVHDIPSIGIYAKGNARETVIEHNRLERIWSNALMLGQSTDAERLIDGRYESYDGVIRDNVVSQVGWACVATASSFNVRIHHNTCVDTGLLTHGAVLVSNESEVGQAGTNVWITHNVFSSRSSRPVIRITSNAMTDRATLHVDHNLYWQNGTPPRFLWPERALDNVPIERWRAATGLDAHSLVADPQLDAAAGHKPRTTSPTLDARKAGADLPGFDAGGCPRPAMIGARPPCPR